MFGMRMPAECSERVSGVRANREIWLFIVLRELIEAGYSFYIAPNGVMSVHDPIPVTYSLLWTWNTGRTSNPGQEDADTLQWKENMRRRKQGKRG